MTGTSPWGCRMSSPSAPSAVFPDLVLLVLPPLICHLHIPKHRVIDDELQHQLLFCDAEVAWVLLLPLVISQAGGRGDSNRHRWWNGWFMGALTRRSWGPWVLRNINRWIIRFGWGCWSSLLPFSSGRGRRCLLLGSHVDSWTSTAIMLQCWKCDAYK